MIDSGAAHVDSKGGGEASGVPAIPAEWLDTRFFDSDRRVRLSLFLRDGAAVPAGARVEIEISMADAKNLSATLTEFAIRTLSGPRPHDVIVSYFQADFARIDAPENPHRGPALVFGDGDDMFAIRLSPGADLVAIEDAIRAYRLSVQPPEV